mgnify:CR=1 FL=1|jgi:hypothetical protein
MSEELKNQVAEDDILGGLDDFANNKEADAEVKKALEEDEANKKSLDQDNLEGFAAGFPKTWAPEPPTKK